MGILKHKIKCLICGTITETVQSGKKYCSNACRQAAYRSVVTNDVTVLRNEVVVLRNTVTSFSKLVSEVAKKLGKNDKWISRQLELHKILLVSDAHHGYTEQEAIFSMKERLSNNSN